MTDARQALGRRGEDEALAHLLREGLSLVVRNWKVPPRPHTGGHGGELDLVMREGDLLVIVEVRTSNARFAGGAAYTVGPAKQRQLGMLAQMLLKQLGWKPRGLRFDVITVAHPGPPNHPDHALRWYRNAITF